ncbi:unnamed protein product [Pleuronectes platessa]|uniref:Uncharacterized protein n=1 Tax=Pleuronectes platessa TaxID=8262 RepID=A0A9N7V4R3_PLEPL|nr:unnamed protein product [Pleuronectes platessa]
MFSMFSRYRGNPDAAACSSSPVRGSRVSGSPAPLRIFSLTLRLRAAARSLSFHPAAHTPPPIQRCAVSTSTSGKDRNQRDLSLLRRRLQDLESTQQLWLEKLGSVVQTDPAAA